MSAQRKQFVTMYMHTINGKPASYEAGYQIHYLGRGRARLFGSLREIRANIEATHAYRGTNCIPGLPPAKYGYVLVRVPSASARRERDT